MKKTSSIKFKQRLSNTIIYIVLSILSFIWILPVVWLVMQSFRLEKGSFTSYFFPKGWTFNNYVRLFSDTKLFNFPQWFMNTFVVAIFSCLITTILVLLTSYALVDCALKLVNR